MANTECTTPGQASRTPMSATGLLTLIDWTGLPVETQQTIRTVGPLIVEGCSRAEMAALLGWPDSRVTAAVTEMRAAILDQCRAILDDVEPRLRDLVDQLGGG